MILIPEIPYDVEKIAEAIRRRSRHGTNFSIVAVAEGAMSRDDARIFDRAEKELERATDLARQERGASAKSPRLKSGIRATRCASPGNLRN